LDSYCVSVIQRLRVLNGRLCLELCFGLWITALLLVFGIVFT